MIKSLRINNIALIDEVMIDFDNGFNVFTGETGAGKSIIIDAITLLLGGKFDKNIIKEGCDKAKVEAVFDIDYTCEDSKIVQALEDLGVEYDNTLTLSRTIEISGKSQYRLNGDVVAMNVFKRVSNELIDVFGQHDNLKLLDSRNHIHFLDEYIGEEVEVIKSDLKGEIAVLSDINTKLRDLCDNPEKRAREIEFLQYEIGDIESKAFVEGEEEELLARKMVLANSEKIYNVTKGVIDDMESPVNILDVLKSASNALGTIAGLDKDIDDSRDRINSLRWELDDILNVISNYVSNINYSETEYEKIMDRLDVINDYKRKYGNSISSILQYLQEAKARVEDLTDCEERLDVLRSEKKECLDRIYDKSYMIHSLRVAKAKDMSSSIVEELGGLGMNNAQFAVQIDFPNKEDDYESRIALNGLDVVEFLFSANLGQSMKPLDNIISGGELSRFALSFKTVVNHNEPDKTLIFDEIDTGIGGNTGSVVGKKLTRISKCCQVLCITHLAQIASFADNHYKIVKTEDNDRTYTSLIHLDDIGRQEEIGRMIGSIINIGYANLHSIELIKESYNYKLSLA
ncbi:MAG: DNA repair protein RecN [Clostridiales bacterium]|nr:DNA repair protein RecN [Clostridiales bacterium]